MALVMTIRQASKSRLGDTIIRYCLPSTSSGKTGFAIICQTARRPASECHDQYIQLVLSWY
ncbi:hypothetical protein NA56DRAFT_642777 [Hyaloscypha hepaticicola]|uniref:Uncharacterized protein n=1 Tax=Hyaloscypha hepaticicola TaxID=2082293 RepID=A0A2J6QFC2_9HELO|nr:hypothetical protein NA56DRAFT_642777 [Hyaloscypha hepaticicola]